MKKLATLFTIIAASFLTAVTVYGTGLTFTVPSNINAERGQDINIPINVANNPGFQVVGLVVRFDPDVLNLRAVNAPVAAMPLNPQFALSLEQGEQWISLLNPNFIDWSGSGAVVMLTFEVLSDAILGASAISVEFTTSPDGAPFDAAGDAVNASTVNGGVMVVDSAFVGSPGAGGVSTPPSVPDFGDIPQTSAMGLNPLMVIIPAAATLFLSTILLISVLRKKRRA
jgi:hypothetical protein